VTQGRLHSQNSRISKSKLCWEKKIRRVDCSGGVEPIDRKGHEDICWGDRTDSNGLYADRGLGFTGECICQSLGNVCLRFVHFLASLT
jgi:hypothetical protein